VILDELLGEIFDLVLDRRGVSSAAIKRRPR